MFTLRYLLLLTLIASFIYAQQSIVKNYTTLDGLPVSKIYDCTQDADGNMWFAAQGGLIKYNGTEWAYYDSLNGTFLNQSFGYIKHYGKDNIVAIPDHTNEPIWFRINGNWHKSDPIMDDYEIFSSCDVKFQNGKINILLITHKSRVFIVNQDSAREVLLNDSENNLINTGIWFGENILLGTSDGLVLYEPKNKLSTRIKETKGQSIYALENNRDTQSIYYLSNSNIGIIKNNELSLITLNLEFDFFNQDLNRIFIKRVQSGEIYFGNVFALYRLNQITGKLQELNTRIGFTTKGATSIFIDYENNIWLTTFRGINKVRSTPFTNFNRNDSLLEDEVTAINQFPDGPIVLGHNTGFSFWINDKILQFPLVKSNPTIFSRILDLVYEPVNDRIWFAAQKLGFGYITRDLKIKWEITEDAKQLNSYMSLIPNFKNKIYYSTNMGIYSKSGGKIDELISNNGLNIRRLEVFNDSLILGASKKGIIVFNTNNELYNVISGPNQNSNNIYDFYKVNEDKWYVGTSDGLYVFTGNSLEKEKNILIDDPIYFIRDEDDNIWFGLMGGAVRYNKKDGNKIIFTSLDGLIGVETNRDAFLYRDSLVYIGTDRGLSIFSVRNYDQDIFNIKPKILFNGYQDQRGFYYRLNDTPSFHSTNNNITLDYHSPSFIDESALEYKIIVNNLDEDKHEVYTTSNTDFEVRNLSPGEYSFGVCVKNINGIFSDTLYSASIVVNSPFYQEIWFFILMTFLSITVSYSLYDYMSKARYSKELELTVEERTQQLKESEKSIRDLTRRIFKAQEEQRERMARDLHDNIAQDMAMIKLGIEELINNSNSQNNSLEQQLASKVSALTKYLRDMSYFLHPNAIKQTGFINAIQSMCSEFSNHTKIVIDFFSNLDENIKLHEEVSSNIYRFIQEALTNIRKHSQASSGIVIIVLKDEQLTIRIEDDGIGFDLEKIKESIEKRSMGMRSMEERILYLGGKFSVKASPGEGTKLSARIPLSAINHFDSLTNSDQESGS